MTSSLVAFLEGPDLVIVAVVIMVLFGSSQLPKLARSLGQAKKELDAGMHEGAPHDGSAQASPRVEGPPPDRPTGSGPTGAS